MERPNVIFLTIDTLRADWLGKQMGGASLTPHMDQLAAEGTRFSQAVTGGSWTQAAFTTIMTSTYASLFGGCLGPLSPGRPSPVAMLAAAGYATAGFSTSPLLSRAYGYQRGFQQFHDLLPGEVDSWLRRVPGGQRLLRRPWFQKVAHALGGTLRPAKLYATAEVLTDGLLEWLDGQEGPFFAWAHYMDVHWPYHLEDTVVGAAETAQMWSDLAELHHANWHGGIITPEQRQHFIGLYADAVRYVDGQVGRLLDGLRQSGRAENTCVIMLADHGEEFLEHGRWGHWENNLHDEIMRIPLLVRAPGAPAGNVVDQLVRTLDLMPTVLDLCGVDVPPDLLEGVSLRPLLFGDQSAPEIPFAVCEMWREAWHIVAVRTTQHKYIWDSRRQSEPLLYDLVADPGETVNCYSGTRDVAAALHMEVMALLERSAGQAVQPAGGAPDMDAAVEARLRGLGYID